MPLYAVSGAVDMSLPLW